MLTEVFEHQTYSHIIEHVQNDIWVSWKVLMMIMFWREKKVNITLL